MLKIEIEIGGRYLAKVSGKLTVVEIQNTLHIGKGWLAVNLCTKARVHVRSAQRLRRAVSEKEWEEQWERLQK